MTKAQRQAEYSENLKAQRKAVYERIIETLNMGGVVQLYNSMRVVNYSQKHVGMFKLGNDGSMYVQRGKSWDCIDYSGVRHYRPVAA